VIALPAGTRIWIAAGVTDMRRGFDGLSAQVQTIVKTPAKSKPLVCSSVRMRSKVGVTKSTDDPRNTPIKCIAGLLIHPDEFWVLVSLPIELFIFHGTIVSIALPS
jgi:hypothetical protein